MCPQTPSLSPEYSHKAGLQAVITRMPLQIRPVTRGGHAGPVTMGRITRGPLSWTRPHCGMTPSPAFVWCRIERRVSLPVLSLSDQRLQRRPRAKGGVFAFAPTPAEAPRKAFIPQRSQTTPPRPRGLHPAGALARTHQNKAKPRKAGPLIENVAKASKRVPTLPSRLRGYCRVP